VASYHESMALHFLLLGSLGDLQLRPSVEHSNCGADLFPGVDTLYIIRLTTRAPPPPHPLRPNGILNSIVTHFTVPLVIATCTRGKYTPAIRDTSECCISYNTKGRYREFTSLRVSVFCTICCVVFGVCVVHPFVGLVQTCSARTIPESGKRP
jgi:hypothetical protein